MRAEVLIVEDETDLADLTALYLEKEGIACTKAPTAETALELCAARSFDLVLLDINLPGMDGFEFLQDFRKHKETPVIILSAREADEDIILGLGMGADDFVVKPLSPRVLSARVRAMLRRKRKNPEAGENYSFGDYVLDAEAYLLKRAGERVSLSGKEFDVLLFLLRQAGKAFTPEEIYRQVWGQNFGDLSTVGVYIQRLRKKLEPDPGNPRFLETVTGKGYRFHTGDSGGTGS